MQLHLHGFALFGCEVTGKDRHVSGERLPEVICIANSLLCQLNMATCGMTSLVARVQSLELWTRI